MHSLPGKAIKKNQRSLTFFEYPRAYILDNLQHLLHRLHFDLADSLCGYAVFISEHLQCFFLILSEPAARDDVA